MEVDVAEVTEHEIWVRSTDMDADQIVNNARYFEYFEQGRLEHLRRLGVIVRPRPAGEPERSFTIAETTCRYRAALRHREVVTVRAWTSEVRTRSFILSYELVRREDGMVAAEGSSAQVWLDTEGRPAALPERVREVLVASMEEAGTRD
jgi:acyl-CoA thioester hydrolase